VERESKDHVAAITAKEVFSFDGPTRFMGNTAGDVVAFANTAESYPGALTDEQRLGLKQKPFDWTEGHPSFFILMTQLMGAIKAMQLPESATIVEAGSGSGWTTEILLALNYRVTCVEPAQAMIDVARERVSDYLRMHDMADLIGNAAFQHSTFEAANIASGSADTVIFFESFHHIADEHRAVAKAVDVLKPGGVLCLLGETNWVPGNVEAEDFWRQETKEFGTLESPFTSAYLKALLEHHGLSAITRHHGISALVPVSRQSEPVQAFAGHLHADCVSLILAWKPPVPPGRLEEAGFANTDGKAQVDRSPPLSTPVSLSLELRAEALALARWYQLAKRMLRSKKRL